MPLTNIINAKEAGQTFQPLLLAEITFADGSVLRLSTHDLRQATTGVQWNHNDYLPRILNSDSAATQALSSLGIDTIPYITLKLADADRTLWQSYEQRKGFKGASVVFRFVFFDVVNKTFSSDSVIKFVGICESPSNDDDSLTVRCMSKMNMAKVYLPAIQIQRVCPWPFPDTTNLTSTQGQALRQAAADDSSSPCYRCGYSPDATGGNARGNYQSGSSPFNSCDQTYASCLARMGNAALGSAHAAILKDNAGRATGRFGGISYITPGSWSGTPWGSSKESKWNPNWDNSGVFNQFMPIVYGTAMVYPPVLNVEGDANSTRGEVLVHLGPIVDSPTFQTFNVGDHDIQCAQGINGAGFPVTDPLRRYNIFSNGGRNGALLTDTATTINDPDPHGGMVTAEFVVLAAECSSNSAPTVRAVIMGKKVPAFMPFNSISSGHINCSNNLLFGEGTDVTITGTGSALDGKTFPTRNNSSNGVDLVGCTGSCGAGYFGGAISDPNQRLGSTPTGLANADNSNVNQQFINGCGANPVWVIMDLLIQAGWSYGDFDMPTWIAAAAVCDRQITDDDGNTHALFSTSLVLKDPKSVADLVRGVRLSCRATLMPSLRNTTNQGLLGIMIEQTLADQQPIDIPESNWHTPVASMDHTGSPKSGYVAYRFSDDNGTILRRNKKSTLQINQQPTNNSFNSISFQFQDSQNSYVTDTITVRDSRDINNIGQEVSYSLPVLGINTYDAGQRCGAWFIGKNLQGNPRGDSKGTWDFRFETSFRAAHLMIGDLILVNSVHDGITDTLARVTSVTPTTDWETMTIEAAWHLDVWCMDTFGEKQFTTRSNVTQSLVRPPLAWSPNQAAPVNSNDPLGQALTFDLTQGYYTDSKGNMQPNLVINGQVPGQSLSSSVIPPLFDMTATATPGTGTIAGGRYYSIAICTQDAAGLWSKPSNIVNVAIPSGLNTYSIKVTGLNWQTYAGQTNTAYGVFLGPDNNHMTLQGSPITTFGSSVTVSSYSPAGMAMPDSQFDHFRAKVFKARHTGSTGAQVVAISGSIITVGAAWTVNCFQNRVLSFIAAESAGLLKVRNYPVISNTANTITVSGNPQADGVQVGDVFVVRLGVTSATANTIQDLAWNGGGYPMGSNVEKGKTLRFLNGTNKGQTYTITGNTTDTVTIQGQFTTTPDSTSIWAITEPDFISTDSPSMPITVPVDNDDGSTILVEVDTVDSTGQECANMLSPVRDIYIYAAGITKTITADYTQQATDGRIFVDSSAGNITITLLDSSLVPNQLLFIQKVSTDTNTVTVNVAAGSDDTFSDGTTTQVLTNQGDCLNLQF